MDDVSIDHTLIKNLIEAWPKRAAVKSSENSAYSTVDNSYISEIPDYPIEIIPFNEHYHFKNITEEQKQEILTWGWLFYNERVIVAEERVANPAFSMLISGIFPGIDEFHIKQALQQCLVDEHYHTLLHMVAINETKKARGLTDIQIQCPYSIIYRRLLEEQNKIASQWEKDLLTLVWTVVSEISINAYLNLLSTNNNIQPMHKHITWLHNRDEYAHSKILVELSKLIYCQLNTKQKKFFVYALDKALDAFTIHDFTMWEAILKYFEIAHYGEIINDCVSKDKSDTIGISLARDFSGLKSLAHELNIVDQLNFWCG